MSTQEGQSETNIAHRQIMGSLARIVRQQEATIESLRERVGDLKEANQELKSQRRIKTERQERLHLEIAKWREALEIVEIQLLGLNQSNLRESIEATVRKALDS